MTIQASHAPALCPPAKNSSSSAGSTSAGWHRQFEAMLPRIESHANIVFRGCQPEAREEAVQEVVCRACAAYARLVEQGRADAVTWSSLAKYGVARVRDGRQVGTSRNVNDVSSWYCQRHKQVQVRNLFEWDDEEKEWRELVVEDRKATPADIAAFRIDFDAWLETLSRRNRALALTLSRGERTSRVAELFRVSAGRISQLRRELAEAWRQFHEGSAATPV
jgi:hypothetical protein